MAVFLLLGMVENEGENHLAVLASCSKREEFLSAVKEATSRPEIKEILCVQGSVLPLKVIDNKIAAIEIAKTEYPLADTVAEFTSNPVYIGGSTNG